MTTEQLRFALLLRGMFVLANWNIMPSPTPILPLMRSSARPAVQVCWGKWVPQFERQPMPDQPYIPPVAGTVLGALRDGRVEDVDTLPDQDWLKENEIMIVVGPNPHR